LLATLEPGDQVLMTDPIYVRRPVYANEPAERLRGAGKRFRDALT
jgi:hypothetical protein